LLGPLTLARLTGWGMELGVDGAVDNAGLEARVRIAERYLGFHDAVVAVEHALAVSPAKL